MSRNPDLLVPELRVKYFEWSKQMDEVGIPHMITCTSRWLEEQMTLYVQHRMSLEEVNKFRDRIGWTPISVKENTKEVTWTLWGKHIPLHSGDLVKAFDFAIIRDGKPTWEVKVSVNQNEIPDYEEAGAIAEKCGLVWGGRFKSKPDYCHCEI